MLIKEVCEVTRLTKKAIEYYIEQGLIDPDVLQNGYRNFSAENIEKLKKIAVLRRLGLGTEDMQRVLADESGEILRKVSARGDLRLRQEKIRQSLLDSLSVERDWDKIAERLESIEKSMTIAERLLDAFPGYYGRFISLHFAGFLDITIKTQEQLQAYEEILRFLDNVPAISFPKEALDIFAEAVPELSVQSAAKINEETINAVKNMEAFLSENKEELKDYLAYKQSDEYRQSMAYKLKSLLKEFNAASGYYEVFIPAMQKLSPSYADYYMQLEAANDLFLSSYPGAEDLE